MQKTEAYHEAAIQYNEGLAEKAEELTPEIDDPIVKKWCISVGKQHRFHAGRHKKALDKIRTRQEPVPVESIPDGLDVPDPDDVEESGTETPEPSTDVQTFPDGCVGSHKPLEREDCEYSPKNMGTSDSNG